MTDPHRSRQKIPNFARFIVTGALVGALLGILLAWLREPAQGQAAQQVLSTYSEGTVIGFIAVFGAFLGGLAGAAIAVMMGPKVTAPRERRPGRRSSRTTDAQRGEQR